MLKYSVIPALLFVLSACNQPLAKKTLADSLHTADTSLKTLSLSRLIVPGKRIGGIYLDANADSLVSKLGKPDSGDAAMGASLMTWIEKSKGSYRTTVYAHRDMGAADEQINHIKQIRITSPWYKTADYAGPGSALKDVRKEYRLKAHNLTKGEKLKWYDDDGAGIGFEVDSTGRCIAVRVYTAGDSSATYLNIP